ncbi:MAG: protein of unknown function containing DUF4329 domain [Rhodobacteraceae bacterium HLUCCA08]|nr:MAG: protein of unknown function containing DUF4329 domain [Rhodobacteraceae bacterium HLUCCA08]
MKRLVLLFALIAGMAQAEKARHPDWEQVDFVTALFGELQMLSINKRREYCGYIGRDASGALVATDPVPGEMASCLPVWPDRGEMTVIASYHTHGAFDIGYLNEIPSDIDLQGDIALGIDGWIATPGGRLWFSDHRAREVRLICGITCLPFSPRFYKGTSGHIAKSYTLEELIRRMEY